MLYYLDSDQLLVLTRVKKRLYDEMTRLGADERRDLANAMDAVLHSVETCGIANEPDPPTTLDATGTTSGKATVEVPTHEASDRLLALHATLELERRARQRVLAVIQEYLDWGAMTSSDRYYFEQKFRALLGEK